jgi:hypothetical protein
MSGKATRRQRGVVLSEATPIPLPIYHPDAERFRLKIAKDQVLAAAGLDQECFSYWVEIIYQCGQRLS